MRAASHCSEAQGRPTNSHDRADRLGDLKCPRSPTAARVGVERVGDAARVVAGVERVDGVIDDDI